MRHKLITGLVGLGVVLGIYFAFFSVSDEQKIKDVLGRLTKAVRVSEGDTNPIVRGARIHSEFVEIFPTDVHVSIPELSGLHQGRSELEGVATKAPLLYRTADVDLTSIEIKLDDAHESAKAGATARLRATRSDGDTQRGPRAVNFLFSKDGGRWRITSMTVWPEGEGVP